MLITKPDRFEQIELAFPQLQSGSSPCTYKASPFVFSHLYGEAREAAAAIGDTSSKVVYPLFAKKIEEHFKLVAGVIDEQMIYFIAQEMERLINELKKTCVSTSAPASS